VAYVKEIMTLSLKDHCVKGLILTGFDSDHSEIVGASIVLRKYRPDWVMYPKYYKDTDEAKRVFALINAEEAARRQTNNPLKKVSVRVDQLANRRLMGLSGKFEFELFSPHIEDMDCSNNCSIMLKPGGSARAASPTSSPATPRIRAGSGSTSSSAARSRRTCSPHPITA
jgi:beta-lactamase superfamily II metal-dependent hydrolase